MANVKHLKTAPKWDAAFTATVSYLVSVDGKIVGRITKHEVSRSNTFWTADKVGTFSTKQAATDALLNR